MFEILNTRSQDFDSYIDVEFSFKISPDNQHRTSFDYLIGINEKFGNLNFYKKGENIYSYFNHCINCSTVEGCVYDLRTIQNEDDLDYPTKDIENIVYKIVKTLELFSH